MNPIVFYPADRNIDKDFPGYDSEPVKECEARSMVQAYFNRMTQIELHISDPGIPMPDIDFKKEKIGINMESDFLKPFFDGSINGCEGMVALDCIDVDEHGNPNTSLVIFAVDKNGNPLPNLAGHKFFEKWPGNLLTETGGVIKKYFPNCLSSRGVLKNNFKLAPELLGGSPVVFSLARGFVHSYNTKWLEIGSHIASAMTPAPQVNPASVQNLVLDISKSEMNTFILDEQPAAIACILCINDLETSKTTDDTYSMIFIALNGSNRPIGLAGIEKWPGLYKVSDLGDALSEVLTPETGDAQQYADARAAANNFSDIWSKLIDDTDGSVTSPRPALKITDQPLAFFFTKGEIEAVCNVKGCEKIAGVWGFNAAHQCIVPLLLGVNSNNRPVSDVLVGKINTAFTLSDITTVTGTLLTEQIA